MAQHRPIVLHNGRLSELPAGDSVEGAGGVEPTPGTPDRLVAYTSGVDGQPFKEAAYFDTPEIAAPAAPASGALRWFANSSAGRVLPHVVGPVGAGTALQPALFGNSVCMWLPGTASTPSINFGTSFTIRVSGTSAQQDHPPKTATTAMTSMARAQFRTGTTATGAAGIQSAAPVAWRGNAPGLGGFFFFARFGLEVWEYRMRAFVGLSTNNATMNSDASSWINTIGLVKPSYDTTWSVVVNGSSGSSMAGTGLPVVEGQILDLILFAPPHAGPLGVRISDAVTRAVLIDAKLGTSSMPSSTTFMYMQAHCQSTAGLVPKILSLGQMYCETGL